MYCTGSLQASILNVCAVSFVADRSDKAICGTKSCTGSIEGSDQARSGGQRANSTFKQLGDCLRAPLGGGPESTSNDFCIYLSKINVK